MENTLVDSAVDAISVSKRTAASGKPYYLIVLTLVNGSEVEVFTDATTAALLTYVTQNEVAKK